MRKVMLVLEDYNELVFVETILKKVGFDAMGVQSDSQISDKVMSFGPHLIIADGFGRKVNGLSISQKIKRLRGFPKFLMVLGPQEHLEESDRERLQISEIIRRPLHPVTLMDVVSEVLKLDGENLRQKMKKLGLFQETPREKLHIVSGKVDAQSTTAPIQSLKISTLSDSERNHRAKKFESELPEPKHNGLDRRKVIEQTRDFRARENDPEIEEIDRERQAFVRALFRR